MEAIVLVDEKWAIGCEGDLLVRIKADLKRFREMTADQVVIYGRKTLESFPGAKPLPDRENWVLSRSTDYTLDGAVVLHDLSEVLNRAAEAEAEGTTVFVIGGAQVYELLLPYCDVLHVTQVDKSWQADAWFPEIIEEGIWREIWRSPVQVAGQTEPFTYHFVRFENSDPKPWPLI